MTKMKDERARGSEVETPHRGAMASLVMRLALFVGAYLAGAGVGKSLGMIQGVDIVYWPPAGIMLGALLMARRRDWGWIVAAGALADLVANQLWFGNPLHLAGIYYGANAIESLLAAWLIRRFVEPFRLETMRDLTLLIVLGAGVAASVGATLIAATDAIVDRHAFWTAFRLVWLGDAAGLLVTTPLVYVTVKEWVRSRTRVSHRFDGDLRARRIEAIALGVVLVSVASAAFAAILISMYFTLPVLLWAAARFQLKGGVAALLVVTLLCAGFALSGTGRFGVAPAQLRDTIVLSQIFLGVCAVSTMLVALLSQRYLDAMASLWATNSELEARVAERTATLARSESQLRAHRERLEHLVDARTQELEESLRKLSLSERMAALGTLSAGLGHDMANILVPMRMSLANLERADLPEARREDVQVLARSSDYLKSLALGLRLLSLDPEDDARDGRTELGAWWPEAATICKAVLPRGIELHAEGLGTSAVAIPSHALTQAVFNLVQNAGDAMRERGEGNVWVRCEVRGDRVALRVRDDGPGMSEEVRARCMEPFYTTKARGRGTGLGLAIVYRVVHRFGGMIEIETAPEVGTEFTMVLPAAEEGGGKSIAALVRVEDARTRAIAQALLSGRGARVVDEMPTNGGAAVLVVDKQGMGTINGFLEGGSDRMVVHLGMEAAPMGDPRVVWVREVRVTSVREAIAGALDRLEEGR